MAKLFEYDESRTQGRKRRPEARAQRTRRVLTPTPIPRRASVSSPGSVRAHTRHPRIYTELQEDDVTCIPTIPRSSTWQYEEDEYEIDSALSLLPEFSPFLPSSPSIDELDTVPPSVENLHNEMLRTTDRAVSVQPAYCNVQFPLEIADPTPQKKARLQFPVERDEPLPQNEISIQFPLEIREKQADISELVTKPPPVPFQAHSVLALSDEPSYIDAVVEADTVMDDTLIVVPSQSVADALYVLQVEDVVDVALTVRARELLRHKGSVEDRPAFIHNPLDYTRWWLLYPGRLEFLFWLGGGLLLGVMMCVVLVMTGLGLGFMSFGHMVH